MKLSQVLAAILVSLPSSLAFIGLGISMYDPSCAFACRAAIASAPLECSEHGGQGGHMGHGASATTPECRAGDTPFLTTLAWCMNSTCAEFDVEAWRLEKYWGDQATGDAEVLPKWTYADTLQLVTQPPETDVDTEETLNATAAVPHDSWHTEKLSMEYFEKQETLHARYGLVLLITGFATPILFTLLAHVPGASGMLDKARPYLVYPSLVGTYQIRPLPYLLGNAPTMGQASYIVMFTIMNIVLTAVNYSSTQPNSWFESTYQEIMAYVSCRTGVLALALAPLVVLFSGRNNILLWMTNWSHSTYMLLHRWVARIFSVQVIVHSVVELALYIDNGSYEEELVLPYWIWGCVATVAACIMLIASMLFVRRWSYEVFLITHIVLAVFVIAGSWYHVEYRFTRKWGYELWLYAAIAVWFADRLMRVLRIAKAGIRRARVTEVSDTIVRIDIDGIRWAATPGLHAYIYFPTLNRLRPWENHPFSIIPTALLQPQPHPSLPPTRTASPSLSPSTPDPEKTAGLTTTTTTTTTTNPAPPSPTTAGLTLYIRRSRGQTSHLSPHLSLPALLDGPYPSSASAHLLHRTDRLLLLAGGIGITALLPHLHLRHHPNTSLRWSVKARDSALVAELQGALGGCAGAEVEVAVGARLDVEGVLAREAARGWGRVGVVVCGPGALCDRVRAGVVGVAREGRGATVWEVEVVAFSW